VTQNVSVVGELLWYDFGSTSVSAFVANPGPIPTTGTTVTTVFTKNDIVVGTLGANYRF
jgi:hypothetical protein